MICSILKAPSICCDAKVGSPLPIILRSPKKLVSLIFFPSKTNGVEIVKLGPRTSRAAAQVKIFKEEAGQSDLFSCNQPLILYFWY